MGKTGAATTAAKAAPSLQMSLPSRKRGKDTFNVILTTAGHLLNEIGFDRLTTNLVCERAGLTPPALYRYFPNKYAILAELARQLMEAQDQALFRWQEAGGLGSADLEETVRRSIVLRKELMTITRTFPGGLWILRAIRALPPLHEVRIASRELVLSRQFDMLRERYPGVSEETLHYAARLSEQSAYGMIEMLIEDPQLDEDRIIAEAAWMTALYFESLADRDPAGRAPPAAPAKTPAATRKPPSTRKATPRRSKG